MANQYRSVGAPAGAVALTATRRTRDGQASLSGKVSVNDEVCVRARMVNQGITFVSQWYPDGKCGS